MSVTNDSNAKSLPALIDVGEVSTLCDCSPKHVYRLAASGKMPPPVRLGALVRWNRAEIERWIELGCPENGGASNAR